MSGDNKKGEEGDFKITSNVVQAIDIGGDSSVCDSSEKEFQMEQGGAGNSQNSAQRKKGKRGSQGEGGSERKTAPRKSRNLQDRTLKYLERSSLKRRTTRPKR